MTHALQQGLHAVKHFLVTAGHNGQGASNGHGITAADGGIQQVHTRLSDGFVQILDDVGGGGAEVDDDVAPLAVVYGVLHGLADNGVGGQDLHDDVTLLINIRLLLHRRTACGGELVQAILGHIKAQHLAAALFYQIFRHRQAHDAQAQETDLHIHTSPY